MEIRKRIFRNVKIFVWVFAILVSLLWFPGGLPFLVLIWFLFANSSASQERYKVAIVSLLIVGVVLLLKNTGFSFGKLAVFLGIIVTSLLYYRDAARRQDKHSQNTRPTWIRASTCVLGIASILYFVDSYQATNCSNELTLWRSGKDEAAIVCIGDSLTAAGYPTQLQKHFSCPVVNFGFDGITTEDVFKMLPKIKEQNPSIVVLEIGGHDFNQGRSRESTLNQMRSLIVNIQRLEAQVILVEIPRGFVSDPYFGIERQLAREFDLALVSDSAIRCFVLFSPIMPPGIWLPESWQLSQDGLHPNELGNHWFAFSIASRIRGNAKNDKASQAFIKPNVGLGF